MIPPPYNSIFTSWVQKKFLYEKSAQLLYNGLSLKIWKICSTKVGNELILRSRDSTRRDATSVVWAHFGLRSFEVATRHDATRLRSYELISDFGRSKSRLDTTRRDLGRMSSFWTSVVRSRDSTRRDATSVVWAHFGQMSSYDRSYVC